MHDYINSKLIISLCLFVICFYLYRFFMHNCVLVIWYRRILEDYGVWFLIILVDQAIVARKSVCCVDTLAI